MITDRHGHIHKRSNCPCGLRIARIRGGFAIATAMLFFYQPLPSTAQRSPQNWTEQLFSGFNQPKPQTSGDVEKTKEHKAQPSVEALEGKLKQNPEDKEALLGLARIYAERKDREKSLTYYLKLQQIDPTNPANAELGRLLLGKGSDPAVSVVVLRTLLRVTPDNPVLKRDLAFALVPFKKSWPEAIDYLKLAVKKDPKDLEAMLQLARLLNWGQFDNAEAANQYKSYLAAKPKDDAVKLEFADFLSHLPASRTQALTLMDEVLKNNPQDAKARILKAQTYTWMGRWHEAINDLRAMLKSKPDDADSVLLLARALNWGQGNQAESIGLYNKYLLKKPKESNIRLELAELYSRQPATRSRALAEYNQVIHSEPGNIKAHSGRAGVYTTMAKWSEAIQDYEFVAAKQPGLTVDGVCNGHRRKLTMPLYIAKISWWAGRNADAIKFYQRYVAANPGDTDARAEFANLLFDSKRWPEALEQYRKIVDRQPDDLDARLHLALIYNELHQKDQCIVEMVDVADHRPQMPAFEEKGEDGKMHPVPAIVALTRFCSMSDDTAGATKAYLRCLDLISGAQLKPVLSGASDLLTNPQLSDDDFKELSSAIEKRDPSNNTPELALALRKQHEGQFEEAIAELEEVDRKTEGHLRIPMDIGGDCRQRPLSVEIGQLDFWLGKKEGAVTRLSTYLESAPDDVNVGLLLGRVLSLQPGNEDKVVRLLEPLMKMPLSPDKIADARISLARSLSSENEGRAIEELNKALAEPTIPSALYTEALFLKANVLAGSGSPLDGEKLILNYLATDKGGKDVQAMALLARIMTYSPEHRDQGLATMHQLLASDHGNEALLSNIADAMIWSERYEEAAKFLETALKEKPDSLNLSLLLAQTYQAAEDHQKSCAIFRQILERTPGNTTALIGLARELNKDDKFDQAKMVLKAEMAKQPTNGQLHLALAEVLAEREPDAAQSEVAEALTLTPRKKAINFASDWVWKAKTRPLARAVALGLLKNNRKDDDAAFLQGTVDGMTPGRKVAGIATMEKFVKEHPQDIGAAMRTADVISWDGRSKHAQELFLKILPLRPNDRHLILDLAQAESGHPKTRENALVRLNTYLTSYPNDVQAKRLVAETNVFKGNRKAGLKQLEALMAGHPDDLGLIAEHAQFLSWNGQIDRAIKEFKQVLAKDPKNKSALIGYASILSWGGNFMHAEKLLAMARALYPHDESVELASASNFRMMGRYDKAFKHLREAAFD